MLSDIKQAAENVGLHLHPDKTKIISNTTRNTGRPTKHHITIGDDNIEILPRHATIKYLGRQIGFEDIHKKELELRIQRGWAAFTKFKQELTSKHYPLSARLRLFESVVTPAVLYGSPAWTLTTGLEHTLQRAQRKMLRMVLGASRRKALTQQRTRHEETTTTAATTYDITTTTTTTTEAQQHDKCDASDDIVSEDDADVMSNITQHSAAGDDEPDEDIMEPWGDWLKRATRQAEEQLRRINIETWTQSARKQKWRFINSVANMNHDRWTKKAAFWEPTTTTEKAKRAEGHPRKRWIDDINKYLLQQHIHNNAWTHSKKKNVWHDLESNYVYDAATTLTTAATTITTTPTPN